PLLGPADSKGVDVVEAAEGHGRFLKPSRLAGRSNLPVNLEPVLLVRRRDLAHPSSNCVRDAGLLLKDPIDFQKSVVEHVVRIIEQYLDHAETFVDRIKEDSVLLLRLAQLLVGCFRLTPSQLFGSQKLLTLSRYPSRIRNVASDCTHAKYSPGSRVPDHKVLIGYRDRFLSLPMPEVGFTVPAALLDHVSDVDIGSERALVNREILWYLVIL